MEKYTELIERYFDGLLTAEEQSQFGKLKSTDSEFQEEFAVFEKAQMILELDALRELKENARKLDKEISIVPKKNSTNWMKIAASILLIAVVGTVFFAQNSYSNEGLYEMAYTPVGDHISDLGSGKTDLESAMQLYNKKEYKKAIEAFSAIENVEPKNQVAKFYLGQSLLLDGQSMQGIYTLLEVSGDYQPEALWYAALGQLKENNTENCISILNQIIEEDQDATFVRKAIKLKSKLESSLRKLVF